MKKYQTELKLEVVKSFLAGEGGAKLLAHKPKLSAFRNAAHKNRAARLTAAMRACDTTATAAARFCSQPGMGNK